MMVEYKCCFCQKLYDWYEGIYKNPDYSFRDKMKAHKNGNEYNEEPNGYIAVNGFTLCRIDPIDDTVCAEKAINAEPAPGNLNIYLNICPDCMRKMLNNRHLTSNGGNPWNII